MRILFVEDDRDVADYVSRGLEEENNSVTVSFDGMSALRAAQSSSFDVIVLDVMLPFLDGFEVTRRLRARSITTPTRRATLRRTLSGACWPACAPELACARPARS